MKRVAFVSEIVERLIDLSREGRIAWYGRRLLQARSRERRHFYWQCMTQEISARSGRQVARMEIKLGLSKGA